MKSIRGDGDNLGIIHNTAEKLGGGLAEHVNYNKDKEEVLTYMFERMLNNIIFLSLLLIFSLVMGVWKQALLFTAIFLPLRSKWGGWHVKSDYLCLAISVVIPIIVAFITKIIDVNYIFIILIYVFAYITAIKIGVVDNPNKRLKLERKAKFKKQGLIILTIITIVHIAIFMAGYAEINDIISITVFLAFFNLWFGK